MTNPTPIDNAVEVAALRLELARLRELLARQEMPADRRFEYTEDTDRGGKTWPEIANGLARKLRGEIERRAYWRETTLQMAGILAESLNPLEDLARLGYLPRRAVLNGWILIGAAGLPTERETQYFVWRNNGKFQFHSAAAVCTASGQWFDHAGGELHDVIAYMPIPALAFPANVE